MKTIFLCLFLIVTTIVKSQTMILDQIFTSDKIKMGEPVDSIQKTWVTDPVLKDKMIPLVAKYKLQHPTIIMDQFTIDEIYFNADSSGNVSSIFFNVSDMDEFEKQIIRDYGQQINQAKFQQHGQTRVSVKGWQVDDWRLSITKNRPVMLFKGNATDFLWKPDPMGINSLYQ